MTILSSNNQRIEIKLSNQQFDHFVKCCEDVTLKPSNKLLNAAKQLDVKNFDCGKAEMNQF